MAFQKDIAKSRWFHVIFLIHCILSLKLIRSINLSNIINDNKSSRYITFGRSKKCNDLFHNQQKLTHITRVCILMRWCVLKMHDVLFILYFTFKKQILKLSPNWKWLIWCRLTQQDLHIHVDRVALDVQIHVGCSTKYSRVNDNPYKKIISIYDWQT